MWFYSVQHNPYATFQTYSTECSHRAPAAVWTVRAEPQSSVSGYMLHISQDMQRPTSSLTFNTGNCNMNLRFTMQERDWGIKDNEEMQAQSSTHCTSVAWLHMVAVTPVNAVNTCTGTLGSKDAETYMTTFKYSWCNLMVSDYLH